MRAGASPTSRGASATSTTAPTRPRKWPARRSPRWRRSSRAGATKSPSGWRGCGRDGKGSGTAAFRWSPGPVLRRGLTRQAPGDSPQQPQRSAEDARLLGRAADRLTQAGAALDRLRAGKRQGRERALELDLIYAAAHPPLDLDHEPGIVAGHKQQLGPGEVTAAQLQRGEVLVRGELEGHRIVLPVDAAAQTDPVDAQDARLLGRVEAQPLDEVPAHREAGHRQPAAVAPDLEPQLGVVGEAPPQVRVDLEAPGLELRAEGTPVDDAGGR